MWWHCLFKPGVYLKFCKEVEGELKFLKNFHKFPLRRRFGTHRQHPIPQILLLRLPGSSSLFQLAKRGRGMLESCDEFLYVIKAPAHAQQRFDEQLWIWRMPEHEAVSLSGKTRGKKGDGCRFLSKQLFPCIPFGYRFFLSLVLDVILSLHGFCF